MYLPRHFDLEDRDLQLAFIERYSFGDLITCSHGVLEVNSLPFIASEDGHFLYAHTARANQHWRHLVEAEDLKVSFRGPDAYISPNWYTDSRNNVPTWNYLSAQVSGKAKILDDGELVDVLRQLSARHEAQFDNPWQIEKLDAKRLNAMVKAIVGIQISIERIEVKAKLSQNKSISEVDSLIAGLRNTGDYNSHQIANWMSNLCR